MSEYKIKIWADIKYVGCKCETVIDLIDEWGLDEESAQDCIKSIKEKGYDMDIDSEVEEEARKIIGFDYGVEIAEATE